MLKKLIFALFLTTAFPAISQNAADSVKVGRADLVSAAEELEAYDQLKIVDAVSGRLIASYSRENHALRLQNSLKEDQIALLRHAYKLLETQNKAQEAQGKRKFSLLNALLIVTAFFGGAFVVSL